MDEGEQEQAEAVDLQPNARRQVRRSRRLWGVLALLGVAAGALVVAAAGDDDGEPRPGLPVALGSSPTRGEAALSADAMLARLSYVAGPDLPALGGSAAAYRLGTPSDDDVAALADALGIGGEVERTDVGWRANGADGTLEVARSRGGEWWYSSTASSPGAANPSGGWVRSTDPASPCTTERPCEVPPVTALPCGEGELDCAVALPSEDEARRTSLALLSATGMDVERATVRAERGFDAWYVTVEMMLDEAATGVVASVGVGAEAAVVNATGHLGAPE